MLSKISDQQEIDRKKTRDEVVARAKQKAEDDRVRQKEEADIRVNIESAIQDLNTNKAGAKLAPEDEVWPTRYREGWVDAIREFWCQQFGGASKEVHVHTIRPVSVANVCTLSSRPLAHSSSITSSIKFDHNLIELV